jgi:hypothetical protein
LPSPLRRFSIKLSCSPLRGVHGMAAQDGKMLRNSSNRWLALVYAATIFVSAFLLFQIQPMISKAILPWFGGTPAVWTICLLFFQTLLFAGYSYAHFTNTWLRPWQQAIVHICVIIVALALLRVLPDSSQQPRGDADPTSAILVLLAITIGLPYFVLSSTGPLLQAWFARSFPGRTPYRLYALSNVGSLLALLSFPFLFERQFDLAQQGRLWAIGFIAFAFLCAYAAWCVRHLELSPQGVAGVEAQQSPQLEAVAGLEVRDESIEQPSGGSPSARPQPPEAPDEEPSATRCFLWLALPAFASVVLMATTNHISTDVAVVPLLWVVPLALYLLTFIIAFDRPSWYWPKLTALLTLLFLYPTSAIYKNNNVGWLYLYKCGMTGRTIETAANAFHGNDGSGATASSSGGPRTYVGFRTALVVNFATMFGICLLCHGQLARLRPSPRYLTTYFLMMSAGGALGGIAVSLIAPHVFKTIFEWQIAIFVAAIGAIGILLYAIVGRAVEYDDESTQKSGFVIPAFAARLLLVLMLVPTAFFILDLMEYLFSPHRGIIYQSRNFFGSLAIREEDADDAKKHALILLNGTTLHGTQFMAPERRGLPTSYYGKPSGVGLVLDWFHNNPPPGGVRIGDVGLGAGTLAAYALKSDHITFYEINPTVIDISTSGKYFAYIADARARGAHCDIKLGDARLTLQRELASPPHSGAGAGEGKNKLKLAEGVLPYHVLVLDAFSGDAVPTHLLTAEAMKIYLPHLATAAEMEVDGALLIHVSNRYLELDRVVRGAAEYIGFECVEIHSAEVNAQSINSADWVVLTHNKGLLAALAPHAAKPEPDEKPPVLWTDAHSSLFEILRQPPPTAQRASAR